ncbi:succinate-semialdehyde dehydrogenase/glutarate-semialdehyde dehydrogenase [Pseudonocardia sediminis]|uniref:Succinate-semialdehyde dehydrogenase/glutarate-semialdehyde dehydrogenase n=1 Tax=Pseudonocardia sediminis TaxID=1397368 RepID=A0A4Q7UTF1_PSEST|nr:NAD-dependent succinate-semialdehyde dehydrogenase [Pseudonocardia sediminis]RZT83263.1 succinate-semialdehyde dehydrogenase/glutarate-semialdehyde dehydrogenase [Pseudonocardia sediminis]
MAISTTNPATGEVVREFDELTDDQIEQKLQRAHDAFQAYRDTTFAQRSGWLRAAADILDAETDEFARLATLEMGKTFASAKGEVSKCAYGLRWYADNAERALADVPWSPKSAPEGARVFTRFQPLGPVLAVMPWNFPYWQVFRFAAPALMAGNVGLLKHASNVPQVATAIEDVFTRAGLPEGAFQTLLVGSSKIEAMIDDDRVRAVTLTGSEPAGREVGARAGKNVKASVLELGGSDPFIVMPSADLDATVEQAVTSRLLNNGQSCINAKRFIVHADVVDAFTEKMVASMEALTVGDPMDDGTDVGPMSQAQGVTDLDKQVRDSVAAGARLLTGGKPLGGPGNFYPPSVLTDIPEDAPAYREELFGPVAMIFRANDVDDAIRIANDSPFGLGGSAWTTDDAEKERFVNEVETGMMYINKFTESTAEVPFGGAKNSGYGRELADFGPQSFVNAKTVWIQ